MKRNNREEQAMLKEQQEREDLIKSICSLVGNNQDLKDLELHLMQKKILGNSEVESINEAHDAKLNQEAYEELLENRATMKQKYFAGRYTSQRYKDNF